MSQTILLVEDDEEVSELLEEALAEMFLLEPVRDLEAALEYLEGGQPADLVIIDLEQTQGEEIFEALRIITDEINGWPDIPVIVLANDQEPELALRSWNLGVEYFVSKPFSAVEILEIAHELTDGD